MILKERAGFTIVELIIVFAILGTLTAVSYPTYVDMTNRAKYSNEKSVVAAVESGVQSYYAKSVLTGRYPPFPATLDDAHNGTYSGTNLFFTSVLEESAFNGWEKSGLSYRGPYGTVYTYDPETGVFTDGRGLIHGWGMDEGYGTGTGTGDFYGEFVGGVDWTENGKISNALNFDGTSGHVSIPDSDALDLTTAGTLGTWFNMDSIKPFGGLIHKGDKADWSDESYTMQFWSGNKVMLGLRDDSGNVTKVVTNTKFQPGQWYHVAATWDPTGMKIYVNGELDNSTTQTAVARVTDGSVNIGAQLGEEYNPDLGNLPYEGTIDEAQIHSGAMTEDEIKLYYDSTK